MQYILIDENSGEFGTGSAVFCRDGGFHEIGTGGPVCIFAADNAALGPMLKMYPNAIAQPVTGRVSN